MIWRWMRERGIQIEANWIQQQQQKAICMLPSQNNTKHKTKTQRKKLENINIYRGIWGDWTNLICIWTQL